MFTNSWFDDQVNPLSPKSEGLNSVMRMGAIFCYTFAQVVCAQVAAHEIGNGSPMYHATPDVLRQQVSTASE